VVFPLLRPITLSAVIILGHISLKIFDLVFVMTFGGPGYSTDMPGLNMFITTFRQDLVAQGAAIATVLLLMVALLIVPYLIWNLRGETER
jgi:glucose/mannose transport system permease protein